MPGLSFRTDTQGFTVLVDPEWLPEIDVSDQLLAQLGTEDEAFGMMFDRKEFLRFKLVNGWAWYQMLPDQTWKEPRDHVVEMYTFFLRDSERWEKAL